MTAMMVAAVVFGGAVTFLAWSSRKPKCPGCHAHALVQGEGVTGVELNRAGERQPYFAYAFRCRKCNAEWRRYNGSGELIARAAFDAGIREPTAGLPEARLR